MAPEDITAITDQIDSAVTVVAAVGLAIVGVLVTIAVFRFVRRAM